MLELIRLASGGLSILLILAMTGVKGPAYAKEFAFLLSLTALLYALDLGFSDAANRRVATRRRYEIPSAPGLFLRLCLFGCATVLVAEMVSRNALLLFCLSGLSFLSFWLIRAYAATRSAERVALAIFSAT